MTFDKSRVGDVGYVLPCLKILKATNMKGEDRKGKKGDSYELLRDMFPLIIGDRFTYDYETDLYLSHKNGLDGKPVALKTLHVINQPQWFKLVKDPVVTKVELIKEGIEVKISSSGKSFVIPHQAIVDLRYKYGKA